MYRSLSAFSAGIELRLRHWVSGCDIAVPVSFAPLGLDDVGAVIPGFALAHPGLLFAAPAGAGHSVTNGPGGAEET